VIQVRISCYTSKGTCTHDRVHNFNRIEEITQYVKLLQNGNVVRVVVDIALPVLHGVN
jgi:hypothetical protein